MLTSSLYDIHYCSLSSSFFLKCPQYNDNCHSARSRQPAVRHLPKVHPHRWGWGKVRGEGQAKVGQLTGRSEAHAGCHRVPGNTRAFVPHSSPRFQGRLRGSLRSRFTGSCLSSTRRTNGQCQAAVKVHGVFPSFRR